MTTQPHGDDAVDSPASAATAAVIDPRAAATRWIVDRGCLRSSDGFAAAIGPMHDGWLWSSVEAPTGLVQRGYTLIEVRS
jgi:hypothetical protein